MATGDINGDGNEGMYVSSLHTCRTHGGNYLCVYVLGVFPYLTMFSIWTGGGVVLFLGQLE